MITGPKRITSLETANDCISWISGYETEAEVQDAAQQIVEYFGLDAFVFGALSRNGEHEHHRYLVGCVCIPLKLNSDSDDVERGSERGAWWVRL